MFKHILIPIDDSKLSEKAIQNGVALARMMKARVTGFTAMPEYQIPTEAEIVTRKAISVAEYEKRAKRKAQAILGKLARKAKAAGVACDTDFVLNDRPDEAIVRAAGEHGCDLILMASHGRSGLSALLIGSETRGVLSKTGIPTLVYR